MQRKDFIQKISLFIGACVLSSYKNFRFNSIEKEENCIIPPYLQNGDTIGITATAGHISLQRISPALKILQSWGFKVQVGNTIGTKHNTFSDTDSNRLKDLQGMLDNTRIKAILIARGGYGSIRILDKVDWTLFKRKPKWIVGFSDATVLHSHLNSNLKVASIHSKMCNSFPTKITSIYNRQIEIIFQLNNVLVGNKISYQISTSAENKIGVTQGELVGGNLKTLLSLNCSTSELQTDGKILFLEDVGEYLYSVDRMFWNLKRSQKLKNIKGLIIGNFKTKKDDSGEEFGKSVKEIILEKLKDYTYPICFDFPIGHQLENYVLKIGVQYKLEVKKRISLLTEI